MYALGCTVCGYYKRVGKVDNDSEVEVEVEVEEENKRWVSQERIRKIKRKSQERQHKAKRVMRHGLYPCLLAGKKKGKLVQ